MVRLCIAALFWLTALAADSAASTFGEARVTARLTPDGVHATVALDRAVTRFSFDEADVVREGDFEILTPGLTLEENTVSSRAPFRRFELRIRPMKAERDAKYPAHYRLGAGGVIYGPALRADPAGWRTRLSFETAPGHVRAPAGAGLGEGFVFLGPPSLLSDRDGVVVVSPPDTPAWLVERTRTDLAAAVKTFTAPLGAPPPVKPTLIVTHDLERTGIVADVTAPGTITIRFHGEPWRRPDPGAAQAIQSLVLHEAFHLWNGVLVHNGADTPAWLHEGGAEYGALLAARTAGALDEAGTNRRLGEALTRCRTALGDKSLADATLSANVRYPCGMAIQWAADLSARRASAGGRTVLNSWGDVVRIASRRPDRTYSLADFYAAAGFMAERMPAAIRLIVEERGQERWEGAAAAFQGLGAELTLGSTPATRLQTVMFHILPQHCPKGQPYGYNGEGEAIVLDTAGRCGPLAGAPKVTAIEGRPVLDESPQLLEAVERQCAAGAEVRFTTADGRTLSARCGAPLPAAPPSYLVRASGLDTRSGVRGPSAASRPLTAATPVSRDRRSAAPVP